MRVGCIRLPKVMLKELKLKTGDSICITKEGNKIIITKISKQFKTLEERFEDYNGTYKPTEMDWGKPVGNEIW